jgi:hypothetical protein
MKEGRTVPFGDGPPKGNRNAVTHGGHAQLVPAAVEAVANVIRPALPVQHAADEWVIAELADALIRLQRFRAFLDANDPWRARGKTQLAKVRSAIRWEDKYATRVLRLLKELGATPAARAKLGVDIARTVSLAEAMSESDPAKRAELMRRAGVDLDEPVTEEP